SGMLIRSRSVALDSDLSPLSQPETAPAFQWTPHKVDQALWIYYLAKELKPQLLDAMPHGEDGVPVAAPSSAVSSSVADAADDNAQAVPIAEEDSQDGAASSSSSSGASNSDSRIVVEDEEDNS